MASLDQRLIIYDANDKSREVSLRTLLTLAGSDMAVWRQGMGFAQDFRGTSFESTLDRMLARVPNDIDKRQGSIIYDTLAPTSTEMSQVEFERQQAIALSYASKSVGHWLDLRVAEHGVTRISANAFIGQAICWADDEMTQPFTNKLGLQPNSTITLPDEYFADGSVITFTVADYLGNGIFRIIATQPGEEPKHYQQGTELLPTVYIDGAAAVTINGTETPGRNEETDQELFERFVDYITNPPFGGNRADYRDRLRHIDGMGGFKLYRADPDKGYVRVVILGSDNLPPTQQYIDTVQEIIDPEGGDGSGKGQGIGEAPMCHYVTIEGASAFSIDIDMVVELQTGINIGQAQPFIEEQIEIYFASLREDWDNLIAIGDYRYIDTIVRPALIEAAILNNVEIVKDIRSALINGQTDNVTITADDVPVLGALNVVTV